MPRASDLGLCPSKNPADWERYYAQITDPADMPWYCAGLDPDVREVLAARDVRSGRFLDLGTGPANHAIELARAGFTVTGSDLSPSAIERARALAAELSVDATFVADDFLDTKLTGPFDLVLDRGCFHTILAERRADYARNLARVLAPGGLFLLKTFCHEDPGTEGPHRFRPEELDEVFGAQLERVDLIKTIYQGTEAEMPRSFLSVWSPRA